MNKEALLQEVYESSFRDEIEKFSSIYDKDVREDLKKVNKKGKWDVAVGLLSGTAAGAYAGRKLMEKVRNPLAKALTYGASGVAGMLGGTSAGAKLQTYKRDKLVKSMPDDNKFKKSYIKNRFSSDNSEAKDFSAAYNKHVKDGTPLSAKHKEMAKVLFDG